MSPKASENWVKKTALRWIWRVQQIGAVSTLVITAITLTLTVSNKIEWRFENPYMSVVLTFILMASVIMSLGYAWDKGRMWHEQNVVNVERNPYYELKMTPKEIFCNEVLWIPLFETVSDLRSRFDPRKSLELKQGAELLGKWNKEQLESDPVLRKSVEKIREHFKHGNT